MSTPETVVNPFAAGSPLVAVPSSASAAAVVQREVAEVQAAIVIAKRFPRDPVAAMDRILQACTRPLLAQAALYQYSRGGTDITGPSIRLAEELARQWGNIVCGVTELTRANGVSECLAYAHDLETNFRDEKRFQVKHWRDTKSGGYALKDERDIYEKLANDGARRKRACLLAVIPGDVQEAAVHQCDATLRAKADVTPERVKAMLEKFAEFGVTPAQIEARIQRNLDAITAPLMVELGRIYNSLRDGMSRPDAWFEVIVPVAASPAEAAKAALRGRRMAAKPESQPDPGPAQDFNPEASRAADAEAPK